MSKALSAVRILGGLFAVVVVALFVGCSDPDISGPTPVHIPTPGPTTTPIPIPIPNAGTNGPLWIDAHRFRDQSGTKVYLLGAIICCRSKENASSAKPDGWPLIGSDSIREISEAGGNYTEIRTGPTRPGSPDGDNTPYCRVSGKVDLNCWDEGYFARVDSVAQQTKAAGLYLLVSLVDGWIIEHGYSPWLRDYNVNGVDAGTCEDMQAPPQDFHRAWVRKIVEVTGRYDHVLYLDGNESFKCDPTQAWEDGLKATVRVAENEFGYRTHPFGTNTENPAFRYLGFETYHQESALPSQGRPLMINEYRSISADEWEEQARAARHGESSFHLWRGSMNETEWRKALSKLRAIREGA